MKKFLRPTLGKFIAPIIFLLIFFLVPLLGFALRMRSLIIFWLFFILAVSFPFLPIIKVLGLTTTSPIYFDMIGGPTLSGLVFIVFFWIIILYLISCLVVYRRKGKESKEQHYQKKIITKKEPETREKPSGWWYLLPIFLSIIGGVISYFLLRNRDRNFAVRLLIIGLIMFAVLIVFQIVFAVLIYMSLGA